MEEARIERRSSRIHGNLIGSHHGADWSGKDPAGPEHGKRGNTSMAIKKVWIEDGCTLCGLCVDECPAVFTMEDTTAVVKTGADLDNNEECIRSAADNCQVDVIKYE